MHPRNCETRQGNKDRVFRFWITLLDQRMRVSWKKILTDYGYS
jgi:hypothetical protein